ncbi:MAG: hypothetical protein P8P74_05650 [Crocinitomicaceae bacterium]|nr:hypothetical protein [Crocinitomicaceae bacterium]
MNSLSFAQQFVPLDSLTFLDRFEQEEWSDQYELIANEDSSKLAVPYLSVRQAEATKIGFIWNDIPLDKRSEVEFFIDTLQIKLDEASFSLDTAIVALPARVDDYSLTVRSEIGEIIAKVNIEVYWYHEVDVVIIPLVKTSLDEQDLSEYLNSIFGQAQLGVHLTIDPIFEHDEIDPKELFVNPSQDFDRYTDQMQQIRELYFEMNPSANKEVYYVCVVPGFVNETIEGYNVLNKALSFVKNYDSDTLIIHRNIAQQLGSSIGALRNTWLNEGPEKESTDNLMDSGFGTKLTKDQWESIHRNCHAFSLFDDYEDVRTNGGLIAYYFWEENNRGEIVAKNGTLFSQLKMPFKRNHYSYHQNITSIFFKPMFTVLSFRINAMHFIALIVVFLIVLFARRLLFRKIRQKSWWLRFGANFGIFLVFLFLVVQSFLFVNRGYRLFEMKGGEITEMKGASVSDMRLEIARGIKPEVLAEDQLGSELFVKKKKKWMLKRRKNVLYFNQYVRNNQTYFKFVKDADSLLISSKSYAEKAESHYIVINYLDGKKVREQRVFNHLRLDITDKISLPNPKKRILLFVNGYRPTANGNSFESTFDSIMKKGLEHENSNNLIYDNDRYNYWESWNEINKRFASKINPEETFYADGHFSVETSNHRSLVDFTSLSQNYPKRCKNPKRHVCQDNEGELTYKMFNLESNRNGFAERNKNGRIAGRNLYQMLNEIPNLSKDDTLYIVAHSMGYAYSLGIIDELRGKINFGGFYIIAPENAEAGKVKMSEWEEIWQYGSDFNENKFKSPCLVDGIAPQTKAGGLSHYNRVFIPDDAYKKKGFFDSHFVGYYTWIFNLSDGDSGFIRQR